MSNTLSLQNIYKSYENKPLLSGISFEVHSGQTVCLLGRSGSGKSTLLRIIAGLEAPDQGCVYWNGENLNTIPVHQRNFGLMFQDYALFPHRNVAENVAFGLRMQGLPKAEVARRTAEALAQVNLTNFANRHVTDLSGGEQQRVALARALAPRPRLLMFDEPLGALDRSLREQLANLLRHILHQTGIPAIYVTHDQDEAFSIADHFILLHEGRIEQQGNPDEIYNHPASAWVAAFLGQTNLLPGQIIQQVPSQIQTQLGPLQVAAPLPPPPLSLTVLLRSEAAQPGPGPYNSLIATIRDVLRRGSVQRVILSPITAPNLELCFDFPSNTAIPAPGQQFSFHLPPEGIQCLV
jgi:ABC-type Fe3+/spermidine/putrescine transport system ATPase subunit